jgi:methylmalonyl-CoA mutase N-terminal domain/subunit
LKRLREGRDNAACRAALAKLKAAGEGSENLMPRILDCSRAYCTLGEMIEVLKSVFGVYKEPIIY